MMAALLPFPPALPPSALSRDLSGRVPLPPLSRAQLGTWKPATLLPFEENSVSGQRRPATPGALQSIIDALMTPGNALRGNYLPQVTNGRVDPYSALIPPALNMASNMMMGASVSPRPTGSLGVGGTDAFDSLLAAARARMSAREAAVNELIQSGKPSVRFEGSAGRALVGPDMSKPGGFRITYFGKDGLPNGHLEFATKEEALSQALRDGMVAK